MTNLLDILPQDAREMIASHVLDAVLLPYLAHMSLRHYAPAGFVAGWKPGMRDGNHVIFQLLCKRLGWKKPLPPDSTWSQHYNLLACEVMRTVYLIEKGQGPEANYERMIRGKPFDVTIANAALYENAPTVMKSSSIARQRQSSGFQPMAFLCSAAHAGVCQPIW